MPTQVLSFARPALGRRALLGMGALALVATVGLSQVGRPDYSGLAANQDVVMHVAYTPMKDLGELTRKSDAAVIGRVVARGATRLIKPDRQQPQAFVPQAPLEGLSREKLEGLNNAPAAPARSRENIITPEGGIPVTQFTVEVTRPLQGSLSKGNKITLNQVGGEISIPLGPGAPTLKRTIFADHDPLLVVGQEQVLFLSRAGDGTFSITGGPDGRFNIDARRTLQPVDHGSLIGNSLKGVTIDSLEARVRTLKGER
ncbi:MAG: hypothetical protein M3336_09745 [Chloroflexota bacterium]|nr:hypothetical protein [Chloroflexota bacterium]